MYIYIVIYTHLTHNTCPQLLSALTTSMCESRTHYKASLCKQWQRRQAWPSRMNDTVSPSSTPYVRVFARGRLSTMLRACVTVLRAFSCACVDVLRACSRACLRAWTSSYVLAWTSRVRAWTSRVHAWTSSCIHVSVRACVGGRLACVRGHIHVYVPSVLRSSAVRTAILIKYF